MSLYNTLFGVNDSAPMLLAILDLDTYDIPRFRDCYLENNAIVIYTRTGGGNRDYYESVEECQKNYPEYFMIGSETIPQGPWNADLRKHPNFVSDKDCGFDCTYAYFFFSFPEKYKDDLVALAEGNDEYTPSEKWQMLVKDLQK